MPPSDIAVLVRELRSRGNDSRSVEAKSAAGGLPKTLASSLCAFANLPGGGTVILGLDESTGFSVVMLDNPRALADGLVSIARQALDPPAQVTVEEVVFEGKKIIVAFVAEIPASAKPCRLTSSRKAYLRFGDGDYELSAVEEEAFVVGRTRPNFDERAVDGATADDFDEQLVVQFQRNARALSSRLRSFGEEDLLVKTGVATKFGVPTVAGIIALGQYPQQFLPAVSIRAALLPTGSSRGQVRALDEATFTGPVTVMLDEALQWVRKNSRNEVVSDNQTGRVSNQLWPPILAVRELIANAIVHRDLAPWSSGRAIEIRMTNEAFRITSPGGLYGVTVASLGTIELTSARNRQLVDICKRLETNDGRVVEALATGIPTVFEELVAAQLPPPGFFDDGISFTAIIHARKVTSSGGEEKRRLASATPALQAVLDILESGPTDLESIARQLAVAKPSVAKRVQKLVHQGRVIADGGRGLRTLYRVA